MTEEQLERFQAHLRAMDTHILGFANSLTGEMAAYYRGVAYGYFRSLDDLEDILNTP